MKALVNRPLPIAFGRPDAITMAGTGHRQARGYRRRQCATSPGEGHCGSPDDNHVDNPRPEPSPDPILEEVL